MPLKKRTTVTAFFPFLALLINFFTFLNLSRVTLIFFNFCPLTSSKKLISYPKRQKRKMSGSMPGVGRTFKHNTYSTNQLFNLFHDQRITNNVSLNPSTLNF